eukprot:NODE_3782_length_732_cov_57.027818_g3185_i0.p1 GENE.NODE_3782_length_732_cov_57.027818_g3185_i0~~NODE_3782_length_732_cov_57.027818_g3185_i0.p1  ORF type:complete len:212 (+),score=30.86 NODE_3782_length_732_cov_57.027818_g3185_i0:64-699(+)
MSSPMAAATLGSGRTTRCTATDEWRRLTARCMRESGGKTSAMDWARCTRLPLTPFTRAPSRWTACMGTASTCVYEGEWRDGKQHGIGELRLRGGNKYKGRWRAGKKEGYGESVVDGEQFSGHYCNNAKHGMGVMVVDGVFYETKHTNGRLESSVEITETNHRAILEALRLRLAYPSTLLEGARVRPEREEEGGPACVPGSSRYPSSPMIVN